MTPREQWISTMKPPSKKLQEFCKTHNISWSEMDYMISNCDNYELDTLNTGNFKERQEIINKYL